MQAVFDSLISVDANVHSGYVFANTIVGSFAVWASLEDQIKDGGRQRCSRKAGVFCRHYLYVINGKSKTHGKWQMVSALHLRLQNHRRHVSTQYPAIVRLFEGAL